MPLVSRECWASSLGGCAGGISREHLISKSQFDSDTIVLRGLPWCPEPKEIGLSSLVAKTLCVAHNSALSPVDEEMLRLKLAIQTIVERRLRSHMIDARLIERWLLKTTVSLVLQGESTTLPSLDALACVAFGEDIPPAGQGFFLVAHIGEQKPFHNGTLEFSTFKRKDAGKVALAAFGFHGWALLYAFDHAPPVSGAVRFDKICQGQATLSFNWKPSITEGDRKMAALKAPSP